MEKASVAVVRCEDYARENVDRAVAEALDLIGGIGRFVHNGQNVLLKPNLLTPFPPEKGVTTHPVVVEAVAKLAKSAGGSLSLGDSSGGITFSGTERALRKCGMQEVAGSVDARVLNFDKEGSLPARGTVFKDFHVAKPVKEADVVISLPRMKNHGEAVITGAVKNMYGAVPGSGKPAGHQAGHNPESFGEVVLDVYQAATPHLAVMDAVIGMEGDGPAHGKLKKAGYILASDNPIALDIAFARLVGIKPRHVPALKSASERGLFPDLENIELLGETQAKVPDWRPTSTFNSIIQAVGRVKALSTFFWEIQKVRPKIAEDRCTKCLVCADSCPVKAIDVPDYPVIDDEKCIYCYCCHELCPSGAVDLEPHWLIRTLSRKWRQEHKE
jgi:uncharacterized protein (DUF362 family)/ferredoxin